MFKGDSHAKRFHRLTLYQILKETGFTPVRVLTLTGIKAGEVGILKYFLALDPSNVIFIDKNPAATAVLEKKWPQATAVTSTIESFLINRSTPFEFINLDFTGYINPKVETCISEAFRLLAPGGFFAITFLRGREKIDTPYWSKIQLEAKRIEGLDYVINLQIARIVVYGRVIRAIAKRYTKISIIYAGSYLSSLPMTTLLFKTNSTSTKKEFEKELSRLGTNSVYEAKQDYKKLVEESFNKLSKTFSFREVKEILNIN